MSSDVSKLGSGVGYWSLIAAIFGVLRHAAIATGHVYSAIRTLHFVPRATQLLTDPQ